MLLNQSSRSNKHGSSDFEGLQNSRAEKQAKDRGGKVAPLSLIKGFMYVLQLARSKGSLMSN